MDHIIHIDHTWSYHLPKDSLSMPLPETKIIIESKRKD